MTWGARTVTLVVNPAAGRGRARRLLPGVCSHLLNELPGVGLRVEVSTDFEDARRLCAEAVQTSDVLLVMGGDGLTHLGLNACAATSVALGVIPAGTGNDFCRGAGLATRVDTAVKAIVGQRRRQVDLLQVAGALRQAGQSRYVGSIVSTGFDARVNHRANTMRAGLGRLGYGYAVLAELAALQPLDYRLRIDGSVIDVPAMLVAVGNAGVFGGGMRMCPEADVTDGLIDVTIVHPVDRGTLVRLLPSAYTGGFAGHPAVERLLARQVDIECPGLRAMADGEELGNTPLQIGIRPGVLTLLG